MPTTTDTLSAPSMACDSSAFARDVLRGLAACPKAIPSKYFYDERGSELFEQIMDLEEYYPTRCEHQILTSHASEIADSIAGRPVRILEAGAGNGRKTEILLRGLLARGCQCEYVPIDICRRSIVQVTRSLYQRLPSRALRIHGIAGEYFEALRKLHRSTALNLVLCLGSNIGNFDSRQAISFLSRLRQVLKPGDLALIGFDLKKDPRLLQPAYDDAQGVTREFNFNLLDRLNRELDAQFDRAKFRHYAAYNPRESCMESWLISAQEQDVAIGALDRVFSFAAWEGMRVERSHKYDLGQIEILAGASGFAVRRHFQDAQGYFVDSLWETAAATFSPSLQSQFPAR